jgi:hypothetical protein
MKEDDDFISGLENKLKDMGQQGETIQQLTKSIDKLAESQTQKINFSKIACSFFAKSLLGIGCIVCVTVLATSGNFNTITAWFPITLGFLSFLTMGK